MILNRYLPRQNVKIVGALTTISLLAVLAGCASSAESPLPSQQRLRVATTTSLYDTGLWGYLEPMFEKKYSVELDVIYAGTGIALEYGRRGDVDVITVHSRSREEQFVGEGYGVKRVPFAYNYFLIVGPASDPVKISGLSPEATFQKLMNAGSGSFISRGDDSGTHAKEKAIWKRAGFDYEAVRKTGEWYIEAGRGMGPTLLMASEKQAYTLTDMGTFLSYKRKTHLVPIVDKGDMLLNVYAAIAVNPEKVPVKNIDMANKLVNYLITPEIQKLIGEYGVKEYGMQLFTPGAGAEPNKQ
ncbi:substrate-binding domain-containing protein [Chloroflexota bacterium]